MLSSLFPSVLFFAANEKVYPLIMISAYPEKEEVDFFVWMVSLYALF